MISLGHLDLNVVENCNFRCTSCSHVSPLNSPWSMPLDMIERDLSALKPFVQFQAINVLGGEPLLHKEIVEVLRLVKRIGVHVRHMVVITNGSLLVRMPEDFWNELDYLQISIYAKLDLANVELAKRKSDQYQFGLGTTVFTHFHKQFRTIPNDGSHFMSCHWRTNCHTVHRGHFALCPQSLFFPRAENEDRFGDCLPLEGLTEYKLNRFLNRTEPMKTCQRCCANEMKPEPWRESSKANWLKDSTQ